MGDLLRWMRGELVEIPGMLGLLLVDIGEALSNWSARHRFTRRELADMAAEAERLWDEVNR